MLLIQIVNDGVNARTTKQGLKQLPTLVKKRERERERERERARERE